MFDTVFLFAVLEYFVWYSKVLDVFMKFGTIMQYGSFGFAFIAPFSLWLPFPTIKYLALFLFCAGNLDSYLK